MPELAEFKLWFQRTDAAELVFLEHRRDGDAERRHFCTHTHTHTHIHSYRQGDQKVSVHLMITAQKHAKIF
jgi:hypothetical protein